MIPYDWLTIEDSHIKRVKFVQNKFDLRGDVHVEFDTGKMYKFKDVPGVRVEAMIHSSRPGKYLVKNIRGEYSSEKL